MDETTLLREQKNIELHFKYSPILYLLDHALRFFLLWLYIKFDLSNWYFIISQLVLIGITGYVSDIFKEKIKSKYKNYINPIYSQEKFDISISENPPEKLLGFQLLFGFIFSFWFFYHWIGEPVWYEYILIIFAAFIGTVFFLIALLTSVSFRTKKLAIEVKVISNKTILQEEKEKIIRKNITSQFPSVLISGILIEPDPIDFDAVDLNDTKIVKLESDLKNYTYKADAWLLESVFLGGLAFSGFLTVASANIVGEETKSFQHFLVHIYSCFSCWSNYGTSSWYLNLSNEFSRMDLYVLIMLLCLLSSVFFLLIITLRLRLNSLTLNLDHILRLLLVFNSKEEEIFNSFQNLENNPLQVARFDKIQNKIDTALNDAEKLLLKINPLFIMMNLYRTIALILFYFVLVLSGFYFVPQVAVAIFALAIGTIVFRKIETYISIEDIRARMKRH